jgi:hypothetical protein
MVVLRNGWPDFLLVDPDRTLGVAIELKSGDPQKAKDARTQEQVLMHAALERFGLEVATLTYDQIGEFGARIPAWRRKRLSAGAEAVADAVTLSHWRGRGVSL